MQKQDQVTVDGKRWTPPSNFIPAGSVLNASVVPRPAYIGRAIARSKRISKAKRAGLGFEKKVNQHFGDKYGERYIPSLWFEFNSKGYGRSRTVQPDALHFDYSTGVITIFEIKLAHTNTAWWQLRRLYQPIIEQYFGDSWVFEVVEVYQWYRLQGGLPEPMEIVQDPLRRSSKFKMYKFQGGS